MRALIGIGILMLVGCQRVDSNRSTSLDEQARPEMRDGDLVPGSAQDGVYAKSDSINAPGAPNNIATPDATTPPPAAPSGSLAPPASSGVTTSDAPSASTTTTLHPDNTGVNQRDRDPDAKTPLDQGENEADRKSTAEIRQRIVNAENMSINARNVKIITSGGRVTLRGPVNSAAEHDTIVRFAREVAGENNVDDQLEVAAATTASPNNP